MYISLVIVAGHLYLSLLHPTTRHALRGITLGTVRTDWARAHHAKWRPPTARPSNRHAPHRRAVRMNSSLHMPGARRTGRIDLSAK
jgi:cytochrome b subunit of formate dehydrogenase